MKALPATLEQEEISEVHELDRGLLLLAEEIARSGRAGDPETPAFIRRLLGRPIEIEEPILPEPQSWAPAPHVTEPFLRSKKARDGSNRYELVFPPPNGPIAERWSRQSPGLELVGSVLAAFLERKSRQAGFALPPSSRQLPALR